MTNQTISQALPVHGEVIVFDRIPVGSYVTAGQAYRVDRPKNKGDFRFVNVARGSSTYDRPYTMKSAAWHAA